MKSQTFYDYFYTGVATKDGYKIGEVSGIASFNDPVMSYNYLRSVILEAAKRDYPEVTEINLTTFNLLQTRQVEL